MVFDITQLRKIRKQLDMTQHAFAEEIGISQSMVAKIESGRLDPTYSYVKKIEEALNRVAKHEEKEAKDIMQKNIFSIGKRESVHKIASLMEKHEISQVLISDKGNFVGLVTERSLLDSKKNDTAEDVMAESPPVVDAHAKLSLIIELLKFYPLVLVKESGKTSGVITKSDVIKSLK